MSDVFSTIVAGVGIFVLGQIILKLLIDPVHDFKKTVAGIADNLIRYANVYCNPGASRHDAKREASENFRQLSSSLSARTYLIPFYSQIAKVSGLPDLVSVTSAATELIGLSNGIHSTHENAGILNAYRRQRICDALGIYMPHRERLDPEGERAFLKGRVE